VKLSILKHEFYKTYIKTRVRFTARLPQCQNKSFYSNLQLKMFVDF
jgi:hypothetical protein